MSLQSDEAAPDVTGAPDPKRYPGAVDRRGRWRAQQAVLLAMLLLVLLVLLATVVLAVQHFVPHHPRR